MSEVSGRPDDVTAAFEKALRDQGSRHYTLRLYIAGMTPRSSAAISTIKQICEEFLEGRYDLEVIDIYQRPKLARDEQILAAPTLVKHLPRPLRRLIGDLSSRKQILVGLDLLPRP